MEKKLIRLDEYKKILVDILIEVDDFCRQNNIHYYLTGGTLIGAVRHKGFIPWDDDIDISMFRDDYDYFIKNFQPKSESIKVLSLYNDTDYNYPFAKVVDNKVGLLEDMPGAVEIGAYIDLFPLDYFAGTTYSEAKRFLNKIQRLKWKRNFKIIRFERRRKLYKNILLFIGKCFTVFTNRRKISEKIDMTVKSKANKNCPYVGVIVNATYGYGEIVNKELYDSTVDLEFEGHKFEAPIGYDKILTSLYGNYMELPPEEKRVSHHSFKCWYR